MKEKSKMIYFIPFILFLCVVVLLWKGLSLHPNEVPSPLINKPAPAFALPTLFDPQKKLTNKDLLGHVTLLNVWASWCSACQEEHLFLTQISEDDRFVLYGLDYKDDPVAAKKLLEEDDNPYKLVAVDKAGDIAIDWGVYGTPETFIIDKKGIIRYKQVGAITPEIWEQELNPLIEVLWKEK